jgi:hypothetical protein
MISKVCKTSLIFLIICSSSYVFADGTEPWAGAYTSGEFAGGVIRDAYCDMVGLLQGTMGGLLFSVAGLVAIAMGVFGEGGQSKNILVVAIGALTSSVAVSLYFGDLGCGTNVQARVLKSAEVSSEVSEVGHVSDADEESQAELF